MRVPDLEYMISDYEDPLCKNCNQSVDKHELVPVYRGGRLVHHDFVCTVRGSYLISTLGRETFYE